MQSRISVSRHKLPGTKIKWRDDVIFTEKKNTFCHVFPEKYYSFVSASLWTGFQTEICNVMFWGRYKKIVLLHKFQFTHMRGRVVSSENEAILGSLLLITRQTDWPIFKTFKLSCDRFLHLPRVLPLLTLVVSQQIYWVCEGSHKFYRKWEGGILLNYSRHCKQAQIAVLDLAKFNKENVYAVFM